VLAVARGIVGHEDRSGHHLRDDHVVTGLVHVLFGVEEAKRHLPDLVGVVEIVALDKTYDVSDARSIEGLASQARFFGKYLECGEALTADSAGLGEPQRGVAGARPNLCLLYTSRCV